MQQLTLREVIKNIDRYDEALTVSFFCKQISAQSICMLVTDEEIDIYKNNINIGLYIIQDVLDNLRIQKENYTEQEAINAINFYIQNDAFIDILT